MPRALQLSTPGPIAERPLRMVDLPQPEPGADEILVEVAACGVCRTDLQLVEGDLATRRLPVVPGHQVVGRVRRIGENVRSWEAGDRVGIGWLGGTCGVCEHCRARGDNLCDEAEFTGWDRDGGFSELMTARADYAYPIPPGFSDTDAAPLLCGGVIGYRSLEISGIEPGQRLGLYGFGASAILTMQVATHWGCTVYVTTRSREEQSRALDMGATWAGPYSALPPDPLDAAITFAPAGFVVVEALKAVKPGGTVAINAIHLDTIPEFPYSLLWRERGIRSVANFTRRDAREFLQLAADIPVRTVVDPYPLADANIALDRLKRGETDGAAVLTVEHADSP
jgi:propanol-preferring alcohol dehydrogenase